MAAKTFNWFLRIGRSEIRLDCLETTDPGQAPNHFEIFLTESDRNKVKEATEMESHPLDHLLTQTAQDVVNMITGFYESFGFLPDKVTTIGDGWLKLYRADSDGREHGLPVEGK
jgi:hypothetical protein